MKKAAKLALAALSNSVGWLMGFHNPFLKPSKNADFRLSATQHCVAVSVTPDNYVSSKFQCMSAFHVDAGQLTMLDIEGLRQLGLFLRQGCVFAVGL
jgi:hypothetical protein